MPPHDLRLILLVEFTVDSTRSPYKALPSEKFPKEELQDHPCRPWYPLSRLPICGARSLEGWWVNRSKWFKTNRFPHGSGGLPGQKPRVHRCPQPRFPGRKRVKRKPDCNGKELENEWNVVVPDPPNKDAAHLKPNSTCCCGGIPTSEIFPVIIVQLANLITRCRDPIAKIRRHNEVGNSHNCLSDQG